MSDPVNFEELQLRIAQDPTRYVRAYSIYSLNLAAALNAGLSASASQKIDTSSQFVWVKGTYSCDLAGAAQTDSTRVIPLVTVQLTDTGSERQLFDVPQAIPAIFGTGEIPAILPVPYLFAKNAQISGLFANYSAATNYSRMQLTLIGYRVYDLRAA